MCRTSTQLGHFVGHQLNICTLLHQQTTCEQQCECCRHQSRAREHSCGDVCWSGKQLNAGIWRKKLCWELRLNPFYKESLEDALGRTSSQSAQQPQSVGLHLLRGVSLGVGLMGTSQSSPNFSSLRGGSTAAARERKGHLDQPHFYAD